MKLDTSNPNYHHDPVTGYRLCRQVHDQVTKFWRAYDGEGKRLCEGPYQDCVAACERHEEARAAA